MINKRIDVRIPDDFLNVFEGTDKLKLPLKKILSDEFLQKNTKFTCLEEMCEKSPYGRKDVYEYDDAFFSELFSAYINETTKYETINEMIGRAAEEFFGVNKYVD